MGIRLVDVRVEAELIVAFHALQTNTDNIIYVIISCIYSCSSL